MDGTTISQFVCDLHICGSCQKRFSDLSDFVEHKKQCTKSAVLIEPVPDVSSYGDMRKTPKGAGGKLIQTTGELPVGSTEMTGAGQLQPASSGAVGVLTLYTQNLTTEKMVVPSAETVDGQTPTLQIQTTNGVQVLSNISVQDLQLLVLASKQQQQQQQQQLGQQLFQGHDQQLQGFMQQQQQQPVVDVIEAADSKADGVAYTGTLPVLQLIDTSRVAQDGQIQHEPAVITEVLQQNLPGQVIQTILQPGLTATQLEQHIKDGSLQQILSTVQTLPDSSTPDLHKTSGSLNGSEPTSRVKIQMSSVDPEQRTERSSFDEQQITTCIPTKADSSQPTEKSSLRLRYGCTYKGCNYVTQYSKNVERHMLIHTGEKPFVCTQCNRRFSRSDKLKNHQRIHTGDKPFKCNQCYYRCGDSSSLKKHKRTHTDERPFKCQICSYASRNSSQLTIHLRTHTGDKPFMCPECCATFKIKSDLNRHRRMHTGEKPYSCSLCDFRTAVNSNLKAHMKTYHSEENMVKCKECDFRTSSKRVFKTHMKSHTPADQRMVCRQCSYTCTNIRLMQTHVRTHSDERPFGCTLCRYATKTRTCLNSHMRNHHPKEYFTKHSRRQNHAEMKSSRSQKRISVVAKCMEKFKCDICGVGFVRADSLRSHLRSHQEKAAYDSQKKQRCQQLTGASQVVSASGTSPTTNTQSVGQEREPCLSSSTYSVSQEHEYAALTQNDIYDSSPVKPEGAQGEVSISEVVSSQKQNSSQDLQSLLPFIQNNHNTAVWENMQNLAMLNQGEGRINEASNGQGHSEQANEIPKQDVEEQTTQHHQHDEALSDDHRQTCSNDHDLQVASSSCSLYGQPSVVQITMDQVIQAPDSSLHIKTSSTQDHGDGSQVGDQSLDDIVHSVGFGSAAMIRPVVPDGQHAGSVIANPHTSLIVSASSLKPDLITSGSRLTALMITDEKQHAESEKSDHVPNMLGQPEQETRFVTSLPVSDVTDSSNITILSAIKNTDDVLKALALSKSTIITVPCGGQPIRVQADSGVSSQFVSESEEAVAENNNSSVDQKPELPLIVQSLYTAPASSNKS